MDNRIFGYARVSTKEQNPQRQIDCLSKYVPNPRDIIIDKASGKDIENRPGLNSLLFSLREGDVLFISSLDRLGRNKAQIKELLTWFKHKKVIVRILDLPTSLVDFGSNEIQDLVNTILIEVMSYFAEAERNLIRSRQQQGIASAKARGIKFGRKKYEFPETWENDYKRWKNKECTARNLMKAYGWASTTFYRKIAEYERNNG